MSHANPKQLRILCDRYDKIQRMNKKMHIAFIVQKFPQTSEVFIIDQIADLLDRGVDVTVFRFEKGDPTHVSDRYLTYAMENRTHTIGMPHSRIKRFLGAVSRAIMLGFDSPISLLRALDIRQSGRRALSLKLLYACAPFAGKSFDLVHCHFGKLANQYLSIRHIMNHKMPMLTSFYGYDISAVPKTKGAHYYDALKRICHAYIVMSNDMKSRVVALGFPEKEITVLPVSIDVEALPFARRSIVEGDTVEILSVGRFVEKKGFDDLLRALAIVKEKATRPFRATIIGGGDLEPQLKQMTHDLDIEDVVVFPGFMKVQDVIKTFLTSHLYVQPSKTASNGDME